jgi:NosR/NirI family transcriptional regulator, nitrous oxide reductase regulator
MRILAIVMAGAAMLAAQAPVDSKQEAQLRRIFPDAASFSPKGGEPPHFKVFKKDPATGSHVLAGLAFWTTELDPLERGYDGPIKMLVGMDTAGVLVGVLVVDHHEPYGYFSVDLPAFSAQFKGKNIRDPFRVGGDVDAVSRASITINSAARAIRDSSRMVAKALLPAEVTK